MAGENEALINSAPGVELGNEIPMFETEEQLQAYLKGNNQEEPPAGGEPGKQGAEGKEKQGKEAGKEGAAAKSPFDKNASLEDEDGGEEEDEEEGEDEPVEYPTMLHFLNEKHGLNLNLEGIEKLSAEEEAEAIGEIIGRMTEGVNQAMGRYEHINTLLEDEEVQLVLEAKAEGKSLKDIAAFYTSTPQGMADDELALRDFKMKYPKAPDEAIQGMVDNLKKSGQFPEFVKSLREQHVEEQRLQQQNYEKQRLEAEKAEREREEQELNEYSEFLSTTNSIYGVPLTDSLKEQLYQITTVRDDQGLTELDYALQSNEGTLLAALGIFAMKDLLRNVSSIQKNKSRAKVVDQLFDEPGKLQSGSGGGRQDADELYSKDVLNRF